MKLNEVDMARLLWCIRHAVLLGGTEKRDVEFNRPSEEDFYRREFRRGSLRFVGHYALSDHNHLKTWDVDVFVGWRTRWLLIRYEVWEGVDQDDGPWWDVIRGELPKMEAEIAAKTRGPSTPDFLASGHLTLIDGGKPDTGKKP
jgi:hypothetical protein